jgi:hypothetical protein
LLLMIRWLKMPIVSRSEIVLEGCIRPVLCLLPIILWVAAFSGLPWTAARGPGVTVAAIVTMAMTWRWGRIWHSAPEQAI